MRLPSFRRLGRSIVWLGAAASTVLIPASLPAQQRYRNVSNQRFRTIGNGPQSALIVDVPIDANAAAVKSAVTVSYKALRKTRDPIMLKELTAMRRNRQVKPGRQLDVVDFAIVRRGGNLMMEAPAGAPAPNAVNALTTSKTGAPTRAAGVTRAGNPPLSFNFPTSGANSWSATNAQRLVGLANGLLTELTTVLGAPAWTGTVTVLNKDPNLGTVNEILGALFVFDPGSGGQPATNTILFPTFSDGQTEFLAMAQAMAQAWHGPNLIGYDAWEKGMSRAFAIIAAQDLKTYPGQPGTAIDPANSFYYTPDYDILNEPALGNNTFTPPTIGAEPGPSVNVTQFGGMMIPRLEMSGSAWLKCYIENPSFFSTFNAAYYAAFTADHTVANDVNRLRTLAANALPGGVEGQMFENWYEQQFVLDTSVTVGTKLYVYSSPTFPSADGTSPAGAAVYLIYYSTTTSGDETNLNGVCQVVYWDYTFTNRLTLPSFGTVTVANGFGTVAPFFQGIGGNPADQMRIAMDFPLNKEYVRVYIPAGQTGTLAAPNTYSGIVVGQDSGALAATFSSGGSITPINAQVTQGAFGAVGNVGTGFSRTTITLAQTGTPTLTFKRNVFIRNGDVAPTFQLAALGSTATLQNSFSNGPQMISLPIRPLLTDMATVLGASPANALIAQFRQDNTIGPDQYLRYPNLPAYSPGYGLWTDFPSVTTPAAPGIIGLPYDPVSQPNVSIGLQYGWNQIGPPYNMALDVTTDVQFQYLGGDPGFYSDAVSAGWIATGIIGYDPVNGYEDITTTTDVNIPINQLEPWTGYWINVTVPEGITMTYMSPTSSAAIITKAARARRAAQSASRAAVGSWKMPLQLTDGKHIATAVIGQTTGASQSFKSAFDMASPPNAPGGTSLKTSLCLPSRAARKPRALQGT